MIDLLLRSTLVVFMIRSTYRCLTENSAVSIGLEVKDYLKLSREKVEDVDSRFFRNEKDELHQFTHRRQFNAV